MPIVVQHGPDLAVLGAAAYAAGRGEAQQRIALAQLRDRGDSGAHQAAAGQRDAEDRRRAELAQQEMDLKQYLGELDIAKAYEMQGRQFEQQRELQGNQFEQQRALLDERQYGQAERLDQRFDRREQLQERQFTHADQAEVNRLEAGLSWIERNMSDPDGNLTSEGQGLRQQYLARLQPLYGRRSGSMQQNQQRTQQEREQDLSSRIVRFEIPGTERVDPVSGRRVMDLEPFVLDQHGMPQRLPHAPDVPLNQIADIDNNFRMANPRLEGEAQGAYEQRIGPLFEQHIQRLTQIRNRINRPPGATVEVPGQPPPAAAVTAAQAAGLAGMAGGAALPGAAAAAAAAGQVFPRADRATINDLEQMIRSQAILRRVSLYEDVPGLRLGQAVELTRRAERLRELFVRYEGQPVARMRPEEQAFVRDTMAELQRALGPGIGGGQAIPQRPLQPPPLRGAPPAGQPVNPAPGQFPFRVPDPRRDPLFSRPGGMQELGPDQE